jgi:putative transposase
MTFQHFDHDGRARFVTFGAHLGIPVLLSDDIRQTVVDAIALTRSQMGLSLIAYVIMPQHVHLVMIPPIDGKVGSIVGQMKELSSQGIHRILEGYDSDQLDRLRVVRRGKCRFRLWKPRCFDHNCRTEEAMWHRVRYCHWNPVRGGLVAHPEDFIWSSYRWYLGYDDVPLAMDVPQGARRGISY